MCQSPHVSISPSVSVSLCQCRCVSLTGVVGAAARQGSAAPEGERDLAAPAAGGECMPLSVTSQSLGHSTCNCWVWVTVVT